MNNQDYRQDIVNRIVLEMEKGIENWRRTWFNGAGGSSVTFPYNPVSNTKYSSHNLLLLATATRMYKSADDNMTIVDSGEKYTDSRWCTFLQAKSADYSIKKGEVGTAIYFYDHRLGIHNTQTNQTKTIYTKNEHEFFDKAVLQFDNKYYPAFTKIAAGYKEQFKPNLPYTDKVQLFGSFVKELAHLSNEPVVFKPVFILNKHHVFNFQQMNNTPELTYTQPQFAPTDRAEQILTNSKARIFHDGIENYYSPVKHEIHLVAKEYHDTPQDYYATALHELSHWTLGEGVERSYGEYKVSDRVLYAKEELVAELSSVFTCAEISLPYNLTNHKNYLASWITALKSGKNELFKALHDASKVTDYIKQFDHAPEKKQELDVKLLQKLDTTQEQSFSINM